MKYRITGNKVYSFKSATRPEWKEPEELINALKHLEANLETGEKQTVKTVANIYKCCYGTLLKKWKHRSYEIKNKIII